MTSASGRGAGPMHSSAGSSALRPEELRCDRVEQAAPIPCSSAKRFHGFGEGEGEGEGTAGLVFPAAGAVAWGRGAERALSWAHPTAAMNTAPKTSPFKWRCRMLCSVWMAWLKTGRFLPDHTLSALSHRLLLWPGATCASRSPHAARRAWQSAVPHCLPGNEMVLTLWILRTCRFAGALLAARPLRSSDPFYQLEALACPPKKTKMGVRPDALRVIGGQRLVGIKFHQPSHCRCHGQLVVEQKKLGAAVIVLPGNIFCGQARRWRKHRCTDIACGAVLGDAISLSPFA